MKSQKDVVKKTLDYIEKNLENEIDLDTIAKNVGYSKFYLNRIFAKNTGITIYKYLRNRKLTIAAEKLVKSDKPIMQISYEAGYDTQQSFTFAFKQMYLYSPQIYRDMGVFIPKQDRISMSRSCVMKHREITTIIRGIAA